MQPQRLPEFVVQVLERTRQIAESTALWPGWNPTQTPLVFHSPTVAYLVGHPAPPEGYVMLEPADGRTVHAGAPTSSMAANTAAEVEGVLSALIILPDKAQEDLGRFARLILHECFHAHQERVLTAVRRPNFQVASLYPEYDSVNNALSVVENRLLARALALAAAAEPRAGSAVGTVPALTLAPAAEPGQDLEAIAAAFVAVRLERHGRLTDLGLERVCQYEAESEFNEGTPTYVEMRAGHPVAELIRNLEALSRGGNGNSYLRYYSTGAATALLLDRLAPGWQEELARGGVTLQSLLHARLAKVLPEVDAVLAQAGYEGLVTEEERLEAERKQQITRLMARIEKGPGVLVEIRVGREVGVTFNPRAVISVRPGVKLHPTGSGLMSHSGVSARMEHVCLEEYEPRRLTLRLRAAPVNQAADGLHLTAPGFELKSPAGAVRTIGDRHLQIDLS